MYNSLATVTRTVVVKEEMKQSNAAAVYNWRTFPKFYQMSVLVAQSYLYTKALGQIT